MRVSTAFNRILQVPGANVTDVTIGDRDIEVTVRLKARSSNCQYLWIGVFQATSVSVC